ncbi:MAG: hypothetical protein SGARI_003412 [Bacillariaceae sp.]
MSSPPASPDPYSQRGGPAPRKWLIDRITGQSKYGNRERPPCPCCWVAPPVGWCPGLLETNCFCRCVGWLGISSSEFCRFWCMNMAFLLNLCGLMLTIYSLLAISDDFIVLTKAGFQEMVWRREGNAEEDAVSLWNPNGLSQQQVVYFDEFCALADDGIERYVRPSDCDNCEAISMNMIIALMVSVVSFVPAFFSEQLRMYSGYDVNCVKAYLTCLGIITVLLNANVIVSFWYGCGQSFFDGTVNYDSSGNVLPEDADEDDIAATIEIETTWGYGLITLVCATGLKFLALVFNICIPTPNVTRDRKEQEIYESIGMPDMSGMKSVGGGSSVAASTQQQSRQIETRSIASSQQQLPQQSQIQQSQQQQSQTQSQASRSMADQVSQSLQRGNYPGDPSLAASAQNRSVGGGTAAGQSFPGDPSLAYPGGPSVAADPSPFADPYYNA